MLAMDSASITKKLLQRIKSYERAHVVVMRTDSIRPTVWLIDVLLVEKPTKSFPG